MTPMPPSSLRPIGIIGLGLMGEAIVIRLASAGLHAHGYDLQTERMAAFAQAGGKAESNAAAVFRSCRHVILSLPTHAEVGEVLASSTHDLRPGGVIIDTTTGDPEATEEIATRLAARGVAYLDATVSGSSSQLREGSAVLMVGGDKDAFAACRDILAPLAREVFHCGPAGSGARMKLVTNVVLGLNRAALAEGLVLARAIGLDARQALNVMQRGPAYSRIMDRKGERMLTGNFTPEARLSQHLKDVRLIIAQGEAAGLPMPLSHAHRAILEEAEASGLGDLDNSALIQVLAARERTEAS